MRRKRKKLFRFLYLIAVFLTTLKAEATSICSDNGAVFDDDNLCKAVCSRCSQAELLDSGASGSCDKNKYQGFVYLNNKTYAVSKSKGFWTDFTNLVIIPDEQTNNLLASILNYYGISEAWIALYDPNQSQNYNSVDKSRFIWRDGTPLSFDNFKSGEPNNYIFNEDIDTVPVLGEHWVEMYSDRTWNDEGYHAYLGGDYKPRDYALVEWSGPLDCVNASVQNDDSSNGIVDTVCNGSTPCYVCGNDAGVYQCDSGIVSFKYDGNKVNLNQYSGEIIISAEGWIDYCFDNSSNNLGCQRYGIEAIKSWMVFIGDDNNYYWLGNPNNSPVCTGEIQLKTLQYVEENNSLRISIPEGVRLLSLSDVESISQLCAEDDRYNLIISIQPAYLCPQNRVQCDAIEEEPYCPEGQLNPERNMCQADATITCPAGYTWDSSIDRCTLQYQCPDSGVLNKQKDRCEKAYTPVCPSNYTYDSTNQVCYKTIDCGIGSYNANTDRCEYPVTFTCPDGYTLNGTTCEYSPPSCPSGTTYSNSLDKCISNATVSCPSGYSWTGQRCESTNIICPSGFSYNSTTNRCERSADVQNKTPNFQLVSQSGSFTGSSYVYVHLKDNRITITRYGITVVYEDVNNVIRFSDHTFSTSSGCLSLSIHYLGDNTFRLWCSEFVYSGTDGGTFTFSGTSVSFPGQSPGYDQYGNIVYGTGGLHYISSNMLCISGPLGTSGPTECAVFGGSTTYTCPSGSTLSGDICIANPSCSNGGNFDGNADVCWVDATIDCPSGTSYDANLDKCVASATCSSGGSLDTVNDKCWIQAGTECPSGWSYDSTNSVCYQNVSCDYVFNPDTDRCEATVSKDCGSYTYSASEDICIQDINCPVDNSFSLSDTIKYDTQLDVCLSEAQHICPAGDNYTYTWSSTPINKCELIPICISGQYNPSNDKCYLGDLSCPLGSQYPCVEMEDGKHYCSDLTCVDAQYGDNYEDSDTPEGANDKRNDGEVDENGRCLGTIYIFNGQDRRCRTPGIETGYSNCCKKTSIWFGLSKCKSNEQYLAKLRSWGKRDGKCHYVGKYCSKKVKAIGCVQHKKTFCCFSSPLARIIQEQGRQQLGISWGEPKNPNCRGFTMEEFQKIDWNKIDFSEWIEEEILPNVENNLKDKLQDTIDNIKDAIQNKY